MGNHERHLDRADAAAAGVPVDTIPPHKARGFHGGLALQTVILCGGRGIRLWPHTREIPKPMVRVGGRPILWHVMKSYERFGYRDFVLCLGYKGDCIRKYFRSRSNGWNIQFAPTGLSTPTGERIKRIEPLIEGKHFFVTYADGLANLDLPRLWEHHLTVGKLATISVVKAPSPFGIVDVDEQGSVLRFQEKPRMDQWINGGFFVFSKGVLGHIEGGDTLEHEVFGRLVRKNQMGAYKHDGFWRCMDTYKDAVELNEIAKRGPPPWHLPPEAPPSTAEV